MANQPTSSMAMNRVLHVGPGLGLEDFETGILIQSLLMFPSRAEGEERCQAVLSLGAAFAREQIRSVPAYAEWLRANRPEYFITPLEAQRRTLRKLKTVLGYRMIAGLMARAFVGRAKLGDTYQLPEGLKRVLPSSIAAWVSAHHAIKSRENLMTRAWRPSLMVLPLVIGLDNVFYEPDSSDTSIFDRQITPIVQALDFQDMASWRKAVLLSHEAEQIVRQADKIKVAENDIVRVVWHD